MPISGSTDFTLTARDVTEDALRRSGVSDIYQAPNAEDSAVALRELEMMLKHWQMNGPHLWLKREDSLSLTQGTEYYDLPHNVLRMLSARIEANGNEIPMTAMSRDEYFDLPQKSSAGYPTQYYLDAQRETSRLYVWPTASDDNYTVNYTYQKRIDDVDSLDNEIEVPKEHLMTVSYNLSDLLNTFYQMPNDRITQKAMQLKAEADDFDREDTFRFVPGYR